MSSRSDSLLTGNESWLVGAAVGVFLLLILLAAVFGFGGVFGAVFFILYAAVVIAVTAFVLWMLYRIAVGVERIADAQERMVRTNEIRARSEHESGRDPTRDPKRE